MCTCHLSSYFFFFNDTATTEIYTLSLHDALPICSDRSGRGMGESMGFQPPCGEPRYRLCADRKSTRLNSSHLVISYAVFCLKKKNRIPEPSRCRTKIGWASSDSESTMTPV